MRSGRSRDWGTNREMGKINTFPVGILHTAHTKWPPSSSASATPWYVPRPPSPLPPADPAPPAARHHRWPGGGTRLPPEVRPQPERRHPRRGQAHAHVCPPRPPTPAPPTNSPPQLRRHRHPRQRLLRRGWCRPERRPCRLCTSTNTGHR